MNTELAFYLDKQCYFENLDIVQPPGSSSPMFNKSLSQGITKNKQPVAVAHKYEAYLLSEMLPQLRSRTLFHPYHK